MAGMTEAELLKICDDSGYEIVKDKTGKSDYYQFSARFWVEDSPAIYATVAEAARECIDINELGDD